MINLLPPEQKTATKFARQNKKLLAWLVAFVMVLAVIFIITIVGILLINLSVRSLNNSAKQAQERISSQSLNEAQKQAETFSNNLETVVRLLKEQLLFSKILKSIGSVLPNDVVLRDINFSASDAAISLNVIGPSNQAVTQAHLNILKSNNGLFSNADLVSIKQEESGYNATIVVQLKKDSQFYFLNNLNNAKKLSP